NNVRGRGGHALYGTACCVSSITEAIHGGGRYTRRHPRRRAKRCGSGRLDRLLCQYTGHARRPFGQSELSRVVAAHPGRSARRLCPPRIAVRAPAGRIETRKEPQLHPALSNIVHSSERAKAGRASAWTAASGENLTLGTLAR